jgi:hypothetical protein
VSPGLKDACGQNTLNLATDLVPILAGESTMKIRLFVAAAVVVCLIRPARLSADEVIDWNNVLLDAARTNSLAPLPMTRVVAAMNTAMYDAVNSIARTHQPYYLDITSDPATSREAAAAQAAHHVLSGMLPVSQSMFDTALAGSLTRMPDGPGKTAGIELGNTVGAAILALRANDGANVVVPYAPGSEPGEWRPTPSANAPAGAPQWANVSPWAMTSPSQFRAPVGPPALNSAEYTTSFNQVKEIGSATSTTRTEDQSNIAQFWVNPAGTSTPVGHWNRIAQTVAKSQGNSLEENARLFALMGTSQADAVISAWDNKYHYNHWRPVTAIREAETDGNPDTAADADWNSFLTTPPYPAYTAGHSTLDGATGALLADFFGADDIAFTSSSEGLVVPDRTYSSFSQAAMEASNSRVYGGIHWSYDIENGLAAGMAVGHFVAATQLRPLTAETAGDFNGDGLLGIDDLTRLSTEIAAGNTDAQYDLDQSGLVDLHDRQHWVTELKQTWIGDTDLDGLFDSTDLILVLAAGEYEDATAGNSGWSTGDWDGNGDFESSDLSAALSDGGYQAGFRAAVSAVPEPASCVMLVMALTGIASHLRQRATWKRSGAATSHSHC